MKRLRQMPTGIVKHWSADEHLAFHHQPATGIVDECNVHFLIYTAIHQLSLFLAENKSDLI
jgi:hypothetical protein